MYQTIRFQGLDGGIDITRLRDRIPRLGKKTIKQKKSRVDGGCAPCAFTPTPGHKKQRTQQHHHPRQARKSLLEKMKGRGKTHQWHGTGSSIETRSLKGASGVRVNVLQLVTRRHAPVMSLDSWNYELHAARVPVTIQRATPHIRQSKNATHSSHDHPLSCTS